MADDTEEEEEESGGGGKKKIIIGVVVLAALGGVYQFVLKSPPPEEETPEALAAAEAEAAADPVEGDIVQLDEMILNTAGPEVGFLRVGIAVVLGEGVLVADFEMRQALAQDVAVEYLSSLTKEELQADGGIPAAKEELSTLLADAYGMDEMDQQIVVRVLFTSFVMQ
ncbi:MAG: flagellar basal body-associated FliL family protein [Actinomycetota bacterium]